MTKQEPRANGSPVNLAERLENLTSKRQEIIRPILEDPREYVLLSVRAMAQRLSTDPATIVRIVRGLGFAAALAPDEGETVAEVFYRDIWTSTDGARWTNTPPREPCWTSRGMIGGSVVFHDRIWLLGGGTYDTPKVRKRSYFNDVWSSADGVSWKRHVEFAPWVARQYHDVAAFDGAALGIGRATTRSDENVASACSVLIRVVSVRSSRSLCSSMTTRCSTTGGRSRRTRTPPFRR